MLTAGINSSMDSVDEEIQALDLNEEDINEEDNFDDDDDIVIGPVEPIAPELDLNVEDQGLPDETNEYIHTLEYQTKQLEQELEECDELIKYDVHDNKARPSQSLVPYDDVKELEELAAEQGLTVEEFKRQLLSQIDDDDFDEDDVDTGYDEINQLQKELADARGDVQHLMDGIDQEMSDFFKNREAKLKEQPLAIEQGDKSSDGEDKEKVNQEVENLEEPVLAIETPSAEKNISQSCQQEDTSADSENKDVLDNKSENGEARSTVKDSNRDEAGALVLPSALTDMKQFIREQLKQTDENLGEREKKLKETFESQRHAEERQMLADEQRRRELQEQFNQEEAVLIEKKKDNERKIEEEIKSREEEIEEEYQNHQAYLERLIEDFEGEKHLYEMTRHEIQEKLAEKKRKAAIEIQRRYKGYRTRKQVSFLIQDLSERKEARQEEKYKLRVMEVEYEMKVRAENEEREKEEQKKKEEKEIKRKTEEKKQQELEKQRQEEAERIAQKVQEEEELKKQEKLEEERKRLKDIEEKRKSEEQKRKEEEKLRKEEERKQKEEEKRLKKEQEKTRKEEEKQKREEEKKKKEEEKKQKLLEEKKRKEETKKKEEEKKLREIEEKKEKILNEGGKKAEDSLKGVSNCDTNISNNDSLGNNTAINIDNPEQETNEDKKSESAGQSEMGDKTKNISTPEKSTNDVSQIKGSNIANSSSSDSEKAELDGQMSSSDQNQHPLSTSESQIKEEKKKEESSSTDSTVCNAAAACNADISSHPTVNSTVEPKSSSVTGLNHVSSSEMPQTNLADGAAEVKRTMPSHEVYKPDPTEQLRLDWIKHCLPWSKVSNEPWKFNQQPGAKVIKRPSSAKKFPPVSEAVVLAAAQAESLRQVSSVKLTDLPGCSLSTLSQCWSLRYLTVSDSNLVCLDGLNACKHLMYINAENNKIEYVDLKDLGALQSIQLSNNQLTGTTGFDGCINLRWLDLSHNKIRRITGFNSLRRLHTLNLSHNQLTSSEGIGQAVTSQELDLSHNFLQSFDKVDKLCLLTRLNLAANNLLQPPVLKNQVLLQRLDLRENSLQSLANLARYWLPLLTELRCGNNRLDFLDGLDKTVNLVTLDVTDNQISDLEALRSGLIYCQNLQYLKIVGNPVVDVYADEYKNIVVHTVPDLYSIDDEPLSGKEPNANSCKDDEFQQMCQTQIKLHQKLRSQFESQRKTFLATNMTSDEDLCSSIFSYCDTSFKIASEHRSTHEFGDIGVTKSISHFRSPVSNLSQSSDSSHSFKHVKELAHENDAQNMKDKFNSCFDNSAFSHQDVRMSISHKTANDNLISDVKLSSGRSFQADKSSQQGKPIPSMSTNSQMTRRSNASFQKSTDPEKIVAVDSDSYEDEDEGLVDVTKDVDVKGTEINFPYSKVPHPPPQPAASYLNEKDKFLMALEGGSGEPSKSFRSSPRSSRISIHNSPTSSPQGRHEMSMNSMNHSGLKEKYNFSETKQEQISAKEKFDMLFSGQQSKADSQPESLQRGKHVEHQCNYNDENFHHREIHHDGNRSSKMNSRVRADVVGNHLATLDNEKGLVNEFGLDTSLDSDFDVDNLDFDIEKYLDMGELDEFLEKGWRPADAPQIPQSNYPVLGRIPDTNGHNGSRDNAPKKGTAVPPLNPQQAWRDSPMAEMKRPPPSPQVPPLANPSPSPSSVASRAETLGGGSVKSKREELAEEWGFKDSRTAEMMMARAKKMKYNAERRRKLNKLDPHQRYQLFRKLEESGKIQHVKPPPAKVLPRKEYFQAREEEAQRQDVERLIEERSRVHRTFEWVHTQVGDHPISTSRINPMPAPVYSNNDHGYSQHNDPSHNASRKTNSPGSDHFDGNSGIGDNSLKQARRYSVDEAFSSQSPMLPPIKINSAPSHHKNERMSWRDNPAEKSDGWGGGKKRRGK